MKPGRTSTWPSAPGSVDPVVIVSPSVKMLFCSVMVSVTPLMASITEVSSGAYRVLSAATEAMNTVICRAETGGTSSRRIAERMARYSLGLMALGG